MLKLKNALFGYKKTDVCEYVDNLTNELNKKHEQEMKALKEENASLKKQIEENNDVLAVSEIIVEAQSFAKGLKEKALAEYEEQARKSQLEAEKTAEHIKKCEEKLAQLRTAIKDVLTETENNLHITQKELDTLGNQAKL